MERLLLISEDPRFQEQCREALSLGGFFVSVASYNGASPKAKPDLVLLDLVNVESRALQSCQALRQARETKGVPILVLTTPDRLGRLSPEVGFDDFALHPCSGAELVARLRLLLARKGLTQKGDLLKAGDLVIDQATYEVRYQGQLIDLTLREYELLAHLVAHRGRVFTREALLSKVWGYDYFGGTRTVDVHIRRLRMKLEDDQERLIQTVRGIGYKFVG